MTRILAESQGPDKATTGAADGIDKETRKGFGTVVRLRRQAAGAAGGAG